MKKEYVIPQTIVMNVEIQNLLEASDPSLQYGGSASKNGEVMSRGSSWEDDEEY